MRLLQSVCHNLYGILCKVGQSRLHVSRDLGTHLLDLRKIPKDLISHVLVRMRNEHIIKALRALERHSESVVAMEILALCTEKALQRCGSFSKRSLCLLSLSDGLLAVPIGRALYALVPDMVGKTEDLVAKLDFLLNECIGRSSRVVAAGRESVVIVYVVEDFHLRVVPFLSKIHAA